MSLRWGIVGYGRFGRVHASAIGGLDGSVVAGVCSRRQIAAEHLPATVETISSDFQKFVRRDDLDVILVATHWRDHFEPAKAALLAGKHLFLEKPLAGTREQCDELVRLSASAKGIAMVGHICRFDARAYLAWEAVRAGKLGRIVYMRSRRNLPIAPGSLRLDKVSPLVGDGVHDADLMMWMMDAAPTRVTGVTVKAHKFAYDDIGCAWLHFDGAVGYVETVWCLPESTATVIDAHLEIIGTEGRIVLDCSVTGLEVTTSAGPRNIDTDYWPLVDGVRQGVLRDELAYFASCAREGRQPQRVTMHEAARAVGVMLCAEESAVVGQTLDFVE
jgi:UDP-N-acetylglucosamine 3-dehydrogenase